MRTWLWVPQCIRDHTLLMSLYLSSKAADANVSWGWNWPTLCPWVLKQLDGGSSVPVCAILYLNIWLMRMFSLAVQRKKGNNLDIQRAQMWGWDHVDIHIIWLLPARRPLRTGLSTTEASEKSPYRRANLNDTLGRIPQEDSVWCKNIGHVWELMNWLSEGK